MGEIIEQFKIVFGFDDKPLQDGLKKIQSTLNSTGSNLDEALKIDSVDNLSDSMKKAETSIKKTTESVKPLNEEVKNVTESSNSLSKVFGSLMATFASFQALKSLTVDYANMNTQLGQQASLIGANVAELDALGNALQYFGGNTESAISSIKSLNGHLQEAKKGQGALIEIARRYGVVVNAYKEPTEALKQLSSQMGRFSDAQRLAIAQQLGLDDSLTRAFKDPKKLNEYIDRMKNLGTATQEDVTISDDFNDSITYLKQLFNALTRDFARVILPSFTKLLKIFSDFIEWVRRHKQLVIIFFTALAIAMAPVLLILGKIAIATLIAFAPLLIAFAKLAIVSLVLEDIYGYFMGWDSVTGDLVKKFPVLGMILEPLRPIVKSISDLFESIVNWLKDPSFKNFEKIWESIKGVIGEVVIAISVGLFNAVGGIGTAFVEIGKIIVSYLSKPFDVFKNEFNSWVDGAKNIGEDIAKSFTSIVDALKNISIAIFDYLSKPFDVFKEKFNGWVDSLKGIGTTISGWFSKDDVKIQNVTVPNTPPVPQQTSSTTQNQSNVYNVNNKFDQNISTATPKAFADQTNSQIVSSITDLRQQNGAL